ncbi:hypothetical protein [Desulforhopalus sp. 52FAK]
MSDSGRAWVGFGQECVGIDWSGPDALHLIDFLCCDLKTSKPAPSRALLQLHVEKERSHYVLTKNDKENLYTGDDYYELAYALINEIIYQVIVDNSDGLAIHAAAVSTSAGGILLPGQSGSGKSTFTAWLLSCGCNYLTDELVVLDVESRAIDSFTRPISFKSGSVPVVKAIAEFEPSSVIEGPNGLMVPHRVFKSNYSQMRPQLSLILFPKYQKDCKTEITRLPGALGCAQLIECYVNARNIENHGISRLSEIMRATPVYQLTYSSFNGLHDALRDEFPTIF